MKKLAALGWATKTLEEVWIPKFSVCPYSNSIFDKADYYFSLYHFDCKNELTYFQVYVEVENCCQALSERLENQRYFFNNK